MCVCVCVCVWEWGVTWILCVLCRILRIDYMYMYTSDHKVSKYLSDPLRVWLNLWLNIPNSTSCPNVTEWTLSYLTHIFCSRSVWSIIILQMYIFISYPSSSLLFIHVCILYSACLPVTRHIYGQWFSVSKMAFSVSEILEFCFKWAEQWKFCSAIDFVHLKKQKFC